LAALISAANANDDLLKAASAGSREGVQAALNRGARIGVSDQFGRTALHMAAARGDLQTIDLLLSSKAPLGAKDSEGLTPLLRAAKSLRGAAVELLLKRGGERQELVSFLSSKDRTGETLFHKAASEGNAECVGVFSSILPDVDMRDNAGRTPLSLVIDNAGVEPGDRRRGYIGSARILLEKGADPSLPDDKGQTPLWYAARHDDGELALLLSEKAVDAAAVAEAYDRGDARIASILTERIKDATAADSMGRTFLHVAAQQGTIGLAEKILAMNVDVNAVDRFSRTPLDIAVNRGDAEMVRLLLTAGANPNRPGERGVTPLELAARRGGTATAELLIDAGAEVNPRGASTPLIEAVEARNTAMAEFLLSKGADPNARDEKGNTPLYYGVETRTGIPGLDIVKLLLERGAAVDDRNSGGATALLRAVEAGKREEASLLLSLGADPNLADENGKTPLSAARESKDDQMIALLSAR
jgi:ankyrin repeat protein